MIDLNSESLRTPSISPEEALALKFRDFADRDFQSFRSPLDTEIRTGERLLQNLRRVFPASTSARIMLDPENIQVGDDSTLVIQVSPKQEDGVTILPDAEYLRDLRTDENIRAVFNKTDPNEGLGFREESLQSPATLVIKYPFDSPLAATKIVALFTKDSYDEASENLSASVTKINSHPSFMKPYSYLLSTMIDTIEEALAQEAKRDKRVALSFGGVQSIEEDKAGKYEIGIGVQLTFNGTPVEGQLPQKHTVALDYNSFYGTPEARWLGKDKAVI